MTDIEKLKKAGILLRKELETRGVSLRQPHKPNSPSETDTGGWSIEIGRVTNPNLIVELWLDRWPNPKRRCFCACFYSSKKENIEMLIDCLPNRLSPVKTFYDKHWTQDSNGVRYLRKPLTQKLMNKPIAEKFASTKSYFLNLYDKGGSPAREKSALDAAAFIQGVALALDKLNAIVPDSAELPEGKLSTVTHLRRERNPKVRKMLLAARRPVGLVCEICKMSRPNLRSDLQEALFEAHHAIPLSNTRERKTRIEDLNLLCASCHRLIHRVMATSASAVSVKEVTRLLGARI